LGAVEAYDESDGKNTSANVWNYPVHLTFCGPAVYEEADGNEQAEWKYKREAVLGQALCWVMVKASDSVFTRERLSWNDEGLISSHVGGW
jgi:hypothetical protein